MDDPVPHRHPLTAYLCHQCFVGIMGEYANDPSYLNRKSFHGGGGGIIG